jgi:hypothetical protein
LFLQEEKMQNKIQRIKDYSKAAAILELYPHCQVATVKSKNHIPNVKKMVTKKEYKGWHRFLNSVLAQNRF